MTCRTLRVQILAFDGVEALDFAGPFEVFTTASRVHGRRHAGEAPLFDVKSAAAAEVVTGRAGLPRLVGEEEPAMEGYLVTDAGRPTTLKTRFISGGQQLLRVAFNQPGPQPERRESMLTELDARVRDVRQGPEGYLYLAVERDQQSGPGSARLTPNGSILRVEPAKN